MLAIKNKKSVVNFILAAILVTVIIFVLSLLIFEYKKAYNSGKNSGTANHPKTEQEITDSITAPASDTGKNISPSKEIIDSLTAPADKSDDSAGNTKKSKTTPAPTPTPISQDIMNSLTAPEK